MAGAAPEDRQSHPVSAHFPPHLSPRAQHSPDCKGAANVLPTESWALLGEENNTSDIDSKNWGICSTPNLPIAKQTTNKNKQNPKSVFLSYNQIKLTSANVLQLPKLMSYIENIVFPGQISQCPQKAAEQ